MERNLQPYDKECMKMAMLKHEETFKEQVYELHRLYRIQKMLMNNMKSSQPRGYVNYTNDEQQNPRRKLDLERPAEEYIMDEGGDGVLEIEDENDIELTLGPTSFRRRKKDETPLNSDTGPSFSSSSTESSYIKRRSTNTHKQTDKREELTDNKWGLIQVPNMNPSFQSGFDVDEQLRQERQKQSPWLFRVLSLNMT
ncbi:hypothetical protein BVC80_9047g39 [Macleaya cordata]|uniref:Uncharacterized protein n=1 Tax=Macleaya cordata TaxID=56857 RepID=A0A200R2Y4_MACCD|nr:hypothetical protein BVC80_9047g39 [Macleaya cordata]